jgi:steroid delta-isomerase-like uncharacterized protein
MAEAQTTTIDAEERVRDVFHGIFEERDLSDPSRYWTERSVDHFIGLGISVRGAEPLAQFFRELFAAIPDWKLEVENVVAEENHAVVQWNAGGTFDGAPWQGLEPTGKPVHIRGVDVIRFDEDGRVDENTVYYDGMEFARQAGIMPPRDSVAERGMIGAANLATRLRRRLRSR